MNLRAFVASAVAVLALTAAVVFAGAQGAVATQGQAILAGQTNTETDGTLLQNTSVNLPDCQADPSAALVGCGRDGIDGYATTIGVYGHGGTWGIFGYGDSYGVQGSSATGTGVVGMTTAENQNGVYGQAGNSAGSGVYGQNDGTGYGVAGRATASSGGTGVLGDAPNSASGIGVEADSASGTALEVNGKATFSRSGIAVVHSGTTHVQVMMSGARTASMILATVQQSGGFYVKYAVPAAGSFTIYINKAPTSPKTVKVAYFVLN